MGFLILADDEDFATIDHGYWALEINISSELISIHRLKSCPGMHRAIASTSSRVSLAVSTSAETVNEVSKSTGSPKFDSTI